MKSGKLYVGAFLLVAARREKDSVVTQRASLRQVGWLVLCCCKSQIPVFSLLLVTSPQGAQASPMLYDLPLPDGSPQLGF